MKQAYSSLFTPYTLGHLTLKNRIVMAPMTRCRAINNIPNELMVQYYAARASAGLLITEGTAPAPDGLGYARIPGLYNDQQIAGWKAITEAVHAKDGKIFVQLMHTGRISHPLNLPADAIVRGPSPIAASNSPMWTDAEGMQPLPIPQQISTAEIPDIVAEWVHSAQSGVKAGFDGIELHRANGYLLDQFLNPASNIRTDQYGGSPENRNRFVLEVAQAVSDAIGKEKIGIRLSPYGAFNEMTADEHTEEQYSMLATGLKQIGIAYIHLVDHSSMGAPEVPQRIKDIIRNTFGGTIILSGGYDAKKANADLEAGKGDLVAFAKSYIANPDFVERITMDAPIEVPDPSTFYTPGETGYISYSSYELQREKTVLPL